MVTGHVRQLRAKDPRRVRIVYEKMRYHEAWENNPGIAARDEQGDLQDYVARERGLRPYCTAKSNDRWTWKRYTPMRGELYFNESERKFGEKYAGLVLLEPSIKASASPNKQWPHERWCALAELLWQAHMKIVQVGPETPAKPLPHTQYVCTPTMRHAAALIAHSVAAVVPEGGLHHVAAAVGTPAVVIFGGYISPEVTGYAGQASIFRFTREHPIGCGYRTPCQHCKNAMASITPDEVMSALISQMLPKAA